MFVGSGFPNWGDPAHHPWTVGGILAYNTEAKMWGEFIAKKKPGAKVAELTLNNDFGKIYAETMQQVAKDKGLTIVESKLHEATATNLDNEIAADPRRQPRCRARRDHRQVLPDGDGRPGRRWLQGHHHRLGTPAPRWHRSSSRSTRPATACTSSASRRTRAIRSTRTIRP